VKRKGFSLVEMLTVLIVLTMVLMLSAALIMGTQTTYRADAELSRRIMAQNAVADLFRDDVAAARAAPAAAEEFSAVDHCLILRRPDDSLVVYRVNGGVLERLEKSGKKGLQRMVLLERDLLHLEFLRSGLGDRLITLRSTEYPERPMGQVRHVLEFSAALGGDLE
jgi:prepilin-type N-terminal cleavage/methylation domain-containing protein